MIHKIISRPRRVGPKDFRCCPFLANRFRLPASRFSCPRIARTLIRSRRQRRRSGGWEFPDRGGLSLRSSLEPTSAATEPGPRGRTPHPPVLRGRWNRSPSRTSRLPLPTLPAPVAARPAAGSPVARRIAAAREPRPCVETPGPLGPGQTRDVSGALSPSSSWGSGNVQRSPRRGWMNR